MQEETITRDEFAFRKEMLERMTRLETILAPLANGRISDIEKDVEKLKEGRAWDRGLAAGISIAVSALFSVLRLIFRVP